jgi:UDPglucose 6-dehydrogenase/GDP-mannose 6-dehydrogenase
MHISIIGAGYVGLVSGLCLADHGHHVACVDTDHERIARLAAGELPLYERGLAELLDRHLGTRFVPTTDAAAAIRDSEVTIIAVGTPFENGAISLRFIKGAAASIGAALADKPGYHVVVVKSTVVPGTTDGCVRQILEHTSGRQCGRDIGLGMNPEFLREGEAVEDFQRPDRIVLGAIDDRTYDVMARIYEGYAAPRIRTNPRTAEMIKYASNALLATLISFSNEIGNLCSAAQGVDVVDVLNAVHLDKRISPATGDGGRVRPDIVSYLRAGCGFGGSCFPKDVRALIRWAAEHDRSTRLLSAVIDTNERQPGELLALLKRHYPSLDGVRMTVLGLAFKAGTDDIRESPALRVIPSLVSEGARVIACDPIAVPPARDALGEDGITYVTSLDEAVRHADAIVLLTAWPEFRRLPELIETVGGLPIVIDGRRVLDKSRTRRYEGIGLGRPQPGATPAAVPLPASITTEFGVLSNQNAPA